MQAREDEDHPGNFMGTKDTEHCAPLNNFPHDPCHAEFSALQSKRVDAFPKERLSDFGGLF